MRFLRPKGVLSGFWVEGQHPEIPDLRQFGEFWAPDGWHVGRHTHCEWEVYFQVKGESVWGYEGRGLKIEAGQGYIVRPGVFHESLSFSRGSQHFYFAEWDIGRWMSESSPLRDLGGFSIIQNAQQLTPYFEMLITEGGVRKGQRQAQMLKHILGLMTLHVEQLFGERVPERPFEELSNAPRGVVYSQTLLERNIGHDWKLEELGRLAGMSPNYLSTAFAKTFGVSPMRYLLQLRIEKARQLLNQTELSITTIAHELGFSSIQHFSIRFKEQTGKSPSAYRKLKGA